MTTPKTIWISLHTTDYWTHPDDEDEIAPTVPYVQKSIADELAEALKTFIVDFDTTRSQFNGQRLQIRNSTYGAACAALTKYREGN